MALKTTLTDRLGIRHPVLLAPMDLVAGDFDVAAVIPGEAVGLIDDPPPAAVIVERVVSEAARLLAAATAASNPGGGVAQRVR